MDEDTKKFIVKALINLIFAVLIIDILIDSIFPKESDEPSWYPEYKLGVETLSDNNSSYIRFLMNSPSAKKCLKKATNKAGRCTSFQSFTTPLYLFILFTYTQYALISLY